MTKTLSHPSPAALALVLVLAVGAPVGMAADPPQLLGYQGVLRDSSGEPLDGTYDMIFRFTDTPTGGTLLLTDLHTGPDAVVVSGGLFTVLLGGGTLSPGTEVSLQDIFSKYAPVYLEVQVVAETLAPRVQIVSTGFALNAGRLGGQLPGNYVDTGPTLQVKQGMLIVDGGFIGTSLNPGGIGVLGEDNTSTGEGRGVYGVSWSDAGVGVLGSALSETGATEGMRGQSTSPDGKGVVGAAFAATGLNYGVFGESQSSNGVGVYGRATSTSGSTTGVGGESFSSLGTGVAGVAHAASGDAWGVYGASTSADGYGVVSDGDSITAGDVYATGTKFFLAEHPFEADLAIRYACLEGDEIGVYRRGSGRLDRGTARVTIPEPFPLVASGRVSVQVTPLEECGGLYVEHDGVSPTGFTVRELGGGTSNAAFTYLVMAERAGYEGTDAVRSLSISDKILTSTAFEPAEKFALRAALMAAPTSSMDPVSRAQLFAALHAGDFDDTCGLLGGCSVEVDAPVAGLGPMEGVAPDVAPAASDAPDASVQTDRRHANRLVSIDTPDRDRPEPPAAMLPPSSLVSVHVVHEPVEAGDVVVLDRSNGGSVRLGSVAADPGVVGVVAFVDDSVLSGGEAPVAIAGAVSCKVDAEYGAIAAGDLLVVSPTPGHAMRSWKPTPGTIIGKAMESLESGTGTITVLLGLR